MLTLTLLIPILAVALDLAFRDPPGLPHPVRYIGRLALLVEDKARAFGSTKAVGALALLAVLVPVWLVVRVTTAIPVLGLLVTLYLAYAGLALGQLLHEGRLILAMLESGRIEDARTSLAGLVSRDVTGLDEAGLRRALAETISENLSDGFVGPFFYLAVLGPVWLWLYKTVSTLDSLWGYKTERYREFGWAAAKTEDVLSFIPARLTALVMIAAGWGMGLPWRQAYENLVADAGQCESPNAGWPMAAAAWLAGASMGGPAVYFGERREKPVLGPADAAWTMEKLRLLLRLAMVSGLVAAAGLSLYAVMLGLAAFHK